MPSPMRTFTSTYVLLIFHFNFKKLWQNTQNTAPYHLKYFKCDFWWHLVHSRCYAIVTNIPSRSPFSLQNWNCLLKDKSRFPSPSPWKPPSTSCLCESEFPGALVEVASHSVCPFVTSSPLLLQCLQGQSMLQYVSESLLFLTLNDVLCM